jgi:UDP-N-acetylglucosamine 2-epimerase
MKILIVGENGRRHDLAGMLETEGLDVGRPPESSVPGPVGNDVAEIATALIAFERLFAEDAPDAVLVVSTSNLALAAVLVATKTRIPVAGLRTGAEDRDRPSELNRRLIAQLADATVSDDPATIAASLRELATV